MPQKMHSNPQPPSQPMLDRSSDPSFADTTVADTVAGTSTPSRQPDSSQDLRRTESETIPHLSSRELVNLANTSADELMDSVFEDVDYMLDKGMSVVPKLAAAQTTDMIAMDGHPGSGLTSDPASQPPTLASPPPPPGAGSFPDAGTPSPSPQLERWGPVVSFALPILGACATLGVTLAAGFLLYGPNPVLRPEVGVTASNVVADTPDRGFADYMERALESIVTTEETTTDPLSVADQDRDNTASDDELDNGRRFANVPERVYIPVYQPPQPSLSALPPVPLNGTLSSSPVASAGTATTATPLAPTPLAPAPLTPAPLMPTPLATPQLAPITAPESPESSTATSPDLSYDHVLVGLLQLGDRSVAMFDHAEGTHRVRVGEPIGASGWSLVSVSETEAVIRRNGDVRSVYIGQSF
ncbi:MAG: hypothetical protein AB4042_07515 [Leptolyngbyaceae cyanobacterium]